MMHELYQNHVWAVNAALYLLLIIVAAITIHRYIGSPVTHGLLEVYKELMALLRGTRSISALDAPIIIIIFVFGMTIIITERAYWSGS